jgi:O-antigen/teichoic acid export membrane protein
MFRAEGRWGSDALWQVGHRTFSAVFIVAGIFVFGFNSSWQVLALWGTPLILLSLLFLYLRNIRPEFGVKLIVYRIAMPLALIDLATTIYFRSDVLVLNYFDIPKQDIGNYVAAYRFFEAVIMAITPVSLLFFRRVRLFDPGAVNKFKKIALSVMVAVGVGLCIAVATHYFSESIVSFTYGDGYEHSAGFLAVLGWSLVFVLPNALLTQALLALELDRIYLISAVIAAVANVLLNFWLVPVLGVEAVPYTTLVTEAILFVCLGGFLITKAPISTTQYII